MKLSTMLQKCWIDVENQHIDIDLNSIVVIDLYFFCIFMFLIFSDFSTFHCLLWHIIKMEATLIVIKLMAITMPSQFLQVKQNCAMNHIKKKKDMLSSLSSQELFKAVNMTALNNSSDDKVLSMVIFSIHKIPQKLMDISIPYTNSNKTNGQGYNMSLRCLLLR